MGKYCDNCGCELKKEARFCPNCGQKIIDVDQNAKVQEINEWQELYQKTYRKAYAVAFQIMKNKEDAQDVLQEAYISAFKNMNSLRDKEKVGAWINQIVANRCKDWLRKKNPALFTDMGSEDNDTDYEESLLNENQEFMPEESIDYEDTKKIMQDILSALPEEQRLCILMYYYEELSVGEIAEALECSTGTVKSRLNYARKFIKTKVEELEKQGTKLYGIAPIPFIVWMLALKENAVEVEAAGRTCWTEIEKKQENHCSKDKLKHSDIKTQGSKAKSKTINDIAKGKIKKNVVKGGSKHIITKAIAGIVTVAVVGVGGYVYSSKKHVTENSQEKQEKVTKEKESQRKEKQEDFELTEEQLHQIQRASGLYDWKQRQQDSEGDRQDYSLELKGKKIPKDIMAYVISHMEDDGWYSSEDLKNTFGYQIKNNKEFEEISQNENTLAAGNDNEDLEKSYKTISITQKKNNEYQIITEVNSWSDEQNSYIRNGIMEITAHRNEKSKTGGFVFEKIDFSTEETTTVNEDVICVVMAAIRTESDRAADLMSFSPVGDYDINQFQNDEFIQYANKVMTSSMNIAPDKEELTTETGVYDGSKLLIAEYEDICKNTLGRTEALDITEGNQVDGESVTFDGFTFDTWFSVSDGCLVSKLDGSVTMKGDIIDYRYEWPNESASYTYKALGYKEEKSRIGFVINKIEVSQKEGIEAE